MSSGKDGFERFDMSFMAAFNPQISMLTFMEAANEMMKNPQRIAEMQKSFCDNIISFMEYSSKKINNEDTSNIEITSSDKRFVDKEWEENTSLNIIKQFYLQMSDWAVNSIEKEENLDNKTKQNLLFYIKQYMNAVHPSNFPFLNPTVVRKTLETEGENIRNGLKMFLKDASKGEITTHDSSYYYLGENLAATPGKVIFKNNLMELIQYSPTTENVHRNPILFIPPWINKFYILDLDNEQSFVKWIVDQGFTVFMISWVNPEAEHYYLGFEDYAKEGVIAALNKINQITKVKDINVVGYCVGGTLISSILASINQKTCKVMSKCNVLSSTLLTTLLDFENAGDLAVFMNEDYLKILDIDAETRNVMNKKFLQNTFSILKSNEMIWNYMVNSYMLGKQPPPHSTLYWNSDSTNLTKSMYEFLAKSLYRDNLLKLGDVELFGTKVDFAKITQPLYVVSMVKDHLVPWKATFDSLKFFKCPMKFVLGGSGHVAGVVNPPHRQKYSFWVNDNVGYENADQWLSEAVEHSGSWWLDWIQWIKDKSGDKVEARVISDFLYDAPGEYVKQ